MLRLMLCVIALLPFAALSPAGSAQGQWDRNQGYANGNGTYQDTCTDVRWDGSNLYARCQKRDGGWRTTSIDSSNCGGQIVNDDGRLRCAASGYYGQQPSYNRPGYGPPPQGYGQPPQGYAPPPYDNGRYGYGQPQGGWQGGMPPGDYQLTCQNMRVEGDHLYASCQKRNGDWRNTSLDFDRCSSPIVNDNGRLKCEGGHQ